MIWWLSFVDESKPVGRRFLGVCLVEASDFVAAIEVSHRRGCNPGGQVRGWPVSDTLRVPLRYQNQLLSQEEAEAADDSFVVVVGVT